MMSDQLLRIARILPLMVIAVAAQGMNTLKPLRYGPNFSNDVHLDAPLGWGTWVPQTTLGMGLDWLEPLKVTHYGDLVPVEGQYLRAQGRIQVSPYYGLVQTALGFAPFKANPKMELRLVYTNMMYFGSNVEMAMGNRTDEHDIGVTWNSDYIYDHMYDEKDNDQIQSFGFWMDFNSQIYVLRLWGSLRYTLMDVNTDYEGKSYDYSRELPVYSRDFVFEAWGFLSFPLHGNIDLNSSIVYMSTGYLRESSGTYTKEPLGYVKQLLGPSLHWDSGKSRMSLMTGFWHRTKDKAFKGDVLEKFLVQFEYQKIWNMPFTN